MKNVRKINAMLRARYKNARNIRHYQGIGSNETWLSADDQPGRIFAGTHEDLQDELALREEGER